MTEPKFKVGDRVRFASDSPDSQPSWVVAEVAVTPRYRFENGDTFWNENYLELAPPEPRATVQFSQFIRNFANASGAWIVSVGGDRSGPYRTREQADYIAAGLNANPSWSL